MVGNMTGPIIVSKHKDAEDVHMFKGIKINQKVRIYGDNFRESYPAQTSAYYVELIDED
ncbi:DUF3221 domain-containing protein [Sutcliffiella rhizosphaerae]|uniref:Phage protein n=1 Tax=Sutcliffiella rhizosphaerae TaxID=2880967 RepID=A0ABM8YSU8_9BACI|nr:DUF3221 domain-containing protein [Sutcliffiella rhizosphaerae]CAG9623042.1 hypothetical protein BACCIP111883_03837 [Sutcliffiella rhizosphaerae]